MTEATLASSAPPLAPHQLLIFLLQLALLLVIALSLGQLAERLRMPAIAGELAAGMVLGPSFLGELAPGFSAWLLPAEPTQMHLLDAVGQVGVLLLVGMTGTHLDLAMLRRRGGIALRVSLSGLLIPLALGIAISWLLPSWMVAGNTERWIFALFLGITMCVSAIPVIAKTLTDMRLLHRDIGQLTMAAGAVDDAVGWVLLSVVSAAATVGVHPGEVSLAVAFLLGFVVLAVLVGRPLVAGAMGLAGRAAEPGPTIATVFVLVMLGATASQALGLEAVFGAFVVGILLGSPGVVDQRKLAALRTVVLSVLAPIFMATAGLRMDLTALVRPSIAVAAVAVLTVAILGKFIGAYVGAKLSRLSTWEAIALGAGMNARGVIEVIVASVGLRIGVLTTATYTIIVLVAIVTSVMAPPLLRWAMRRVTQTAEERLRLATHEAWAGRTAPICETERGVV